MVLYLGDTQVANVALTDTFNTWRTRFNSAIMDAASISKENAHTAGSTFTGRLSTPKLLANNVTIEVLGDFKGNLSSGTFTSNNYTGNIKTVNEIAANGKVTAPKFIANTLTGTISTAAQPNITSVGTLSGVTLSANVLLGDNDAINFGPAHDLQIVHDGSDSKITDAGTGNLKITSSQVDILGTGETMATFVDDGAVTLYYDNAAKLATKADGVDITGELQSDTLDVDGNADISGNLVLGGNLTVNGTTSTVNSTTVTIDDPIFTLGGDTAPGSDDNKDRGIEFNWHNGSTAKVGFFGFDDSAGKFTFIPDATNSSEVFSGSAGTIVANLEGNVTGTIQTAAQASITSVGTLTSLTLGGTLDVGGNSLQNATYTDLHPATHNLSSSDLAIDFSIPVNKMVLDAARTFSEENKAAHRSIILLLDTSASDHDPTFSSNIKFVNATTPTWDDYRYWVISMICLDSTNVLASATGHDT